MNKVLFLVIGLGFSHAMASGLSDLSGTWVGAAELRGSNGVVGCEKLCISFEESQGVMTESLAYSCGASGNYFSVRHFRESGNNELFTIDATTKVGEFKNGILQLSLPSNNRDPGITQTVKLARKWIGLDETRGTASYSGLAGIVASKVTAQNRCKAF
jgi:hypothetical protein